jgi:hypothetical protein
MTGSGSRTIYVGAAILVAAGLVLSPLIAEKAFPKPIPSTPVLSPPTPKPRASISPHFRIKRENNGLRVTVVNASSHPIAFSIYPTRWEAHIFDGEGRETSEPNTFYAAAEMMPERAEDWIRLEPGAKYSFMASAYSGSHTMPLSTIDGRAEMTYLSGGYEGALDPINGAVLIDTQRAICDLP